jgi:LysM repeat protein
MAKEKKSFVPPPTPIKLDAPESLDGSETPKRGRVALPEFDAPQEKSRVKMKMPPPPPQIKPGEMPRRKKMSAPKPPAQKQRRQASFLQKITQIRINPMYFRVAGFLAWGAAAIAVIAISVWFISSLLVNNAFSVMLDGEHIGYIDLNENLTSEEFHAHAILRLEATRGGVRVQTNQRVTLEETRAPSNERVRHDDIFSRLIRMFEYQIAATAIYVNDNFEVLIKTENDLAHVKYLLADDMANENTVKELSEFVGNWEEVTRFVCPDETEFWEPVDAYARLSRTTMQRYPYTVADGDNLGRIAIRYGTTVHKIMGDNNLTSTNISIGQQLMIYTSRPLVTVRSYDDFPTMEHIEMPLQEIETTELPLHQTRVIQQGQAGQQVVILRVTRDNDTEIARETLEPEVLIEPITHIIERGTGAAGIERR